MSGIAGKVIVWLALAIANVREMSRAALKFALPACDAVTVHEPAPVMWTDAPLTVQLPEAENDTGRPEDADALTAKSGSPNVLPDSAANVIAWSPFAIAKVRATSGAAKCVASPACDAVTVHEPTPVT